MRSLLVDDPERIGDYAVLGRLGHGAMGTVYLARSPGGRPVAVKVAKPELAADPAFRDRFRQEVAMARAVGGFWTAAVVDADPNADRPWLATEYVPGPNLHQAITAHGPLPEPALRRLVAGLAEALAAIHAAGLVHRDLKPSNVLLAADGPRVIDFGIAKAVQSAGLTATGMVVGTPGYLSPEQIRGGEVGPASDVFALGSVLVYAATGAGPFGSGDVNSLVYRAVHTPPNVDGVPDGLRALASRCLDPRPELRPAPAALLAEIGPAATEGWLPAQLLAEVDRQRTELLAAAPRPATREYTALTGTPGSSAMFRTSRFSALLWGLLTSVAAIVCGGLSDGSSKAHNGGAALLFLIGFVLLAVAAGRLLWNLVRPKSFVEVSGAGLTIGRGVIRRELGWPSIARVRVVDDRRRPWLVVWLHGAPPPELGVAHHGGFRVFPVGHDRPRRSRAREVRELGAALGFYGGPTYDPDHR
jgi:serine/threonine protein kinase